MEEGGHLPHRVVQPHRSSRPVSVGATGDSGTLRDAMGVTDPSLWS